MEKLSERNEMYVLRSSNITAGFQRKLPLSIKAAPSQTCLSEADPEPASPEGLLRGSGKKAHRWNKTRRRKEEKQEPLESTDTAPKQALCHLHGTQGHAASTRPGE